MLLAIRLYREAVTSYSPGVAALRGYPGIGSEGRSTPTGLRLIFICHVKGATPLGLISLTVVFAGEPRSAATLGCKR